MVLKFKLRFNLRMKKKLTTQKKVMKMKTQEKWSKHKTVNKRNLAVSNQWVCISIFLTSIAKNCLKKMMSSNFLRVLFYTFLFKKYKLDTPNMYLNLLPVLCFFGLYPSSIIIFCP